MACNEESTSRSIKLETAVAMGENESNVTKQPASSSPSFVLILFMYLAMAFIAVPIILFVYTNRGHVLSFVNNIQEKLLPTIPATETLNVDYSKQAFGDIDVAGNGGNNEL